MFSYLKMSIEKQNEGIINARHLQENSSSALKPTLSSLNEKSAYYNPKPLIVNGSGNDIVYQHVPITSGELQQRIINRMSLGSRANRFRFFGGDILGIRGAGIGFSLLFGTIAAVYMANVIITYEKKCLVDGLLKERNRLRLLLS